MSDIKVIKGELFKDVRGTIASLNNFYFEDVKRSYFIHHPSVDVIRGWNGHKYERKWFYCVRGSFTLAFVRPDNWENPSEDLEVEIFNVSDEESKIICLPRRYASCIKANSADSTLMVLSDKTVEESVDDSWKFDSSLWCN